VLPFDFFKVNDFFSRGQPSTLALFVAGVFTDDPHDTVALDNATVFAATFY
jgi:hypothetical protein